ncbi:MAG: GTP-binding protein [Candidatus Lokiarchaeota archaeon]|nr:GTP-binding protein [Candidatus Lokiarchaeota archaeon]
MLTLQSEIVFKICIFGDNGAGKTSFINRYLTSNFHSFYSKLEGVDFYSKKVKIDSQKVALQIWDFSAEDRYRFLLPSFVSGCHAAIFMFDMTDFKSLRHSEEWLNMFRKGYNQKIEGTSLPIILVGGKSDLRHKRVISRMQAEKIVSTQNLYLYLECSAKTGENVDLIFENITDLIRERTGNLVY